MEGMQTAAREAELTEGGVGDIRDGDGEGLKWWEDNLANVTLGTYPNNPLTCATGLEHHHPIMSKLGDPVGRLYIERRVEFRRIG